MNKMVFLSFFYGLLFPFGFFLGAVSLFVHYWVDKVCLLVSPHGLSKPIKFILRQFLIFHLY